MTGGAKAHCDGVVAFSQTDFTEDLESSRRTRDFLMACPPLTSMSSTPICWSSSSLDRSGSASPIVEAVPAGPKSRRLDDVDRQAEAVTDAPRLVGVAAEGDRSAALLPPPPDQLDRGKGRAGVDLQRPVGGGQRPEYGPVVLLEVGLSVGARAPGRPVSTRIVAVGEDVEHCRALDKRHHVGEVAVHQVVRLDPAEQRGVRIYQRAVNRNGVQAAQDPIE